jgi:hypothetical protein
LALSCDPKACTVCPEGIVECCNAFLGLSAGLCAACARRIGCVHAEGATFTPTVSPTTKNAASEGGGDSNGSIGIGSLSTAHVVGIALVLVVCVACVVVVGRGCGCGCSRCPAGATNLNGKNRGGRRGQRQMASPHTTTSTGK